jgi:hypothetical protein
METGRVLSELAKKLDLDHELLANRAYLLSFRDQTLVARRIALEDAIRYRAELPPDAEVHTRHLALLGLIGETLQVLEDLASLGRPLVAAIQGVPYYASATVINDRDVNNFWSQMKNQPANYILRLAGLRFEGRPLHDLMEIGEQLEPDDIAALEDAEAATEKLLREHLVRLAGVWDRYRHFFHAFKHGGLLINPVDVEMVVDRKRAIPAFAAWRRHRSAPEIGPHAEEPTDFIADQMVQEGYAALDLGEHLVDMRLGIFDHLQFDNEGALVGLDPSLRPWFFFFRKRDVKPETVEILRERFGITLAAPRGVAAASRHAERSERAAR